MLEVGEIVLTNNMVAGKRSVEFAEYHQHGWRPSPIGYHAICDLDSFKTENENEFLAICVN